MMKTAMYSNNYHQNSCFEHDNGCQNITHKSYIWSHYTQTGAPCLAILSVMGQSLQGQKY